MYDIKRLNDFEYYTHMFKLVEDEAMKACSHEYAFSHIYKLPFDRWRNGHKYVVRFSCSIHKCKHCGHVILKKPIESEFLPNRI